ncbi:MAG: hypothetical protein ABR541_04615, partial [Candidatus Dormibacteria bacterium]
RVGRLAGVGLPRRPVALASAAALALGAGVAGGALGLRGGPSALFGAGAAASPSNRFSAAMAFDGTGVVLFGGNDGRRSLGDTWRWDGTRWAQLHPAHAPTPRDHALAVYDQATQRVLLIGGWSMLPGSGPAAGPGGPALGRPCFAGTLQGGNGQGGSVKVLPTQSGGLLPIGGGNCPTISRHAAEVWSWDGSDWSRRAALPLLGDGSVVGATTDRTGRVVIDELAFDVQGPQGAARCPVPAPAEGQGRGTASVGDTGTATSSTAPRLVGAPTAPGGYVVEPAAVFPCSFAVPAPRHRILTGDGNGWRITQSAGPLLASVPGASITYDSASGEVVAFANNGVCRGPLGLDTVDGRAPAQPGVVTASPAASSRGSQAVRCLAVGRPAAAATCCSSTEYAIRGGAWAELAGVEVPPLYAILSDPGRGLVGLGQAAYQRGGRPDSATFEWDGHRWSQRPHANPPPARFDFASAADGRGHVLLFGGESRDEGGIHQLGDLWSWDGSAWTRLAGSPPVPAPPPSEPPCPVSGPLLGGTVAGTPTAAPGNAGSPANPQTPTQVAPGIAGQTSNGQPVAPVAVPPPPHAICGPGLMQPLVGPAPSSTGGSVSTP